MSLIKFFPQSTIVMATTPAIDYYIYMRQSDHLVQGKKGVLVHNPLCENEKGV